MVDVEETLAYTFKYGLNAMLLLKQTHLIEMLVVVKGNHISFSAQGISHFQHSNC